MNNSNNAVAQINEDQFNLRNFEQTVLNIGYERERLISSIKQVEEEQSEYEKQVIECTKQKEQHIIETSRLEKDTQGIKERRENALRNMERLKSTHFLMQEHSRTLHQVIERTSSEHNLKILKMKETCGKYKGILESYIRIYETTDEWPQIAKHQHEINEKKARIETIRHEQAQYGIKTNAMRNEVKTARARLNANIVDVAKAYANLERLRRNERQLDLECEALENELKAKRAENERNEASKTKGLSTISIEPVKSLIELNRPRMFPSAYDYFMNKSQCQTATQPASNLTNASLNKENGEIERRIESLHKKLNDSKQQFSSSLSQTMPIQSRIQTSSELAKNVSVNESQGTSETAKLSQSQAIILSQKATNEEVLSQRKANEIEAPTDSSQVMMPSNETVQDVASQLISMPNRSIANPPPDYIQSNSSIEVSQPRLELNEAQVALPSNGDTQPTQTTLNQIVFAPNFINLLKPNEPELKQNPVQPVNQQQANSFFSFNFNNPSQKRDSTLKPFSFF